MNSMVIDRKFAPYKNKTQYDIKIPANIFQTWSSKNLPPLMFKNIQFI